MSQNSCLQILDMFFKKNKKSQVEEEWFATFLKFQNYA